ncbi:rhodanese-like domain-containing protein [Nocardiopsis sp. JB363]|uniref:MBL fold metallo-hydrolase n=1 Tax=Nocardiopsis sp. JB363 TaxID=1434837 RepID=UPI00097AD519|nr:MBL fold metallo-hydrolase [Nocardiopsis sp. JB363]SIO85370.1 Hydroxyacylglutathione hydrolase [Nocardiopsis sp. JB363]
MLLERVYDNDLSQAGYLIGCQATGEAVVVDARRDIDDYLDLAREHGMRIVAVTETHIHADYLSGTRELAAATGATVYVSGEGGRDWQYGFEARRLLDGDAITVGNVTVRARHTPGHTPEHLSFLVTDGAFSQEPGYMLSGDFVFAGDLGRPDLLDEAAGGIDTRFEGARLLFTSLREVFLTLPDHVQVLPGHGAGSACGKALGALPATTVGYERINAWWGSYLREDDRDGFIEELLDGQPDAHSYFARMKRQNKEGPRVLGPLTPPPELGTEAIRRSLAEDEIVLVDTRSHTEVHRGTMAGALNIPGPAKAATFGAWVYDPETETRPLVLLTSDADDARKVRDHLLRVGIDQVAGHTTTMEGLPTFVPERVTPAELAETEVALVLDVRNRTEHAEGHIPGSRQLSVGRALWNLDALPSEGAIVSYCQAGARSSVAAGALRRAGYHVVELDGGYADWAAREQDRAGSEAISG